jgi:release factor glutamine methyltransferase
MTTLGPLMANIRKRLAAAGIEDPAAEARILVGGLLGLGRTDFISRGDMPLTPADMARIEAAIGRRLLGEPPYRILGSRGFRGLELKLSQGTLEPRPDTEILVEVALDLLGARRNDCLRIIDLGTGTGAICLALLSEMPQARGIGVDISADALQTAVDNAGANGLGDRFEALRSDWFGAVSGTYDVIVSNPPYIRSDVIATLDRAVREHDPLVALDGGKDGLEPYRIIARQAQPFLAPDGVICVETGYDQHDAVKAIFIENSFAQVLARKDYGGNDRVQVFGNQL